MPVRIYRTCAGCGREDINVPRTAPGGPVYYCPFCRGEPWYFTKDRLSTGRRGPHPPPPAAAVPLPQRGRLWKGG